MPPYDPATAAIPADAAAAGAGAVASSINNSFLARLWRFVWPHNFLNPNGLQVLWRKSGAVAFAPDDYVEDKRWLVRPVPAAVPLRLQSQLKFLLGETSLVLASMQISQALHLHLDLLDAPDFALGIGLLWPQAVMIASYMLLRWPARKIFPTFMRMPLPFEAEAAVQSTMAANSRGGVLSAALLRWLWRLVKLVALVYVLVILVRLRFTSVFSTSARSELDLPVDPLLTELALDFFATDGGVGTKSSSSSSSSPSSSSSSSSSSPPLSAHTGLTGLGAVVAYGPLLEELFFRGLVLARMTRVLGMVPGLLISTALFNDIHRGHSGATMAASDNDGEDHSADSVGGAERAGLLFGLSYLATKSLFAPVMLHSGMNLGVSMPAMGCSPALPLHVLTHSLGLMHSYAAMVSEAATIATRNVKERSFTSQQKQQYDAKNEGWIQPQQHQVTTAASTSAGPIGALPAAATAEPMSAQLTPEARSLVRSLFSRLDRGSKGYLTPDELAWAAALMPDQHVWLNSTLSVLERRLRSEETIRFYQQRLQMLQGAPLLETPSEHFFPVAPSSASSSSSQTASELGPPAPAAESAASVTAAGATPQLPPGPSVPEFLQKRGLEPAWLLLSALPLRGLHKTNATTASSRPAIEVQKDVFVRYYTIYWRAFYAAQFPELDSQLSLTPEDLAAARARGFTSTEALQLRTVSERLNNHWQGLLRCVTQKDSELLQRMREHPVAAEAERIALHEQPLVSCTSQRFEEWVGAALVRRPLPTQRWLLTLAAELQPRLQTYPALGLGPAPAQLHPTEAMLLLHDSGGRQLVLEGHRRIGVELMLPKFFAKLLLPKDARAQMEESLKKQKQEEEQKKKEHKS
jgi:membrane protease YdiL (CAAX protease family)